jgi:hypothetical protein
MEELVLCAGAYASGAPSSTSAAGHEEDKPRAACRGLVYPCRVSGVPCG